MVSFKVNEEKCIKCGLCAKDCIVGVIKMDEYPKITDEAKCMKCQHCFAVCPTGAISILGLDPEKATPLKDNLPDPKKVETLIKGRRSVRQYKAENLDKETIDSLVKTAWHAPTGTNAEQVNITVINDIEVTNKLRDEVYKRLDELKESGKAPECFEMQYLGWASKMHKEKGIDVIFRGAPHIIIAAAPKKIASPDADCHIYLSSFELLAQAHGIGTLWNGMLKWTFELILPDLKKRLGIPEDHKIGYTMIFGKPAVKYARTVIKEKPLIKYISKEI
jgi:Fe-S-cluster-containing hydrogenase component 2